MKDTLTAQDDHGLVLARYQSASTIKSTAQRNKYLSTPFTNSKKRNLLYRLVMLWVNRGHPMGKGVRMPVPACVVNLVQTHFPSSSYTGYMDAEVELEGVANDTDHTISDSSSEQGDSESE